MAATGFYIRRSGYTHVGELMLAVVADMTANGFVARFPNPWAPPADAVGRAKFSVTLEAGPLVDKLNLETLDVKQPWRINVQVFDKHTCALTAGSQQAVRTDGSLSFANGGSALKGPLGSIGGYWTKTPTTLALIQPDTTKLAEGFINRTSRVVMGAVDLSESYPMTYTLSITDRGVSLCVWEDYVSDSGAQAISWFVIQRPVDRVNGSTILTGKCPVFCLSGVNNVINRFMVRESDVLRPSEPVDATIDTDYNNAIINALEQVAISEGNKYVVAFPSRLNSTRYAYTYELDMLGYTSADVVSENTDVPLKVYNEQTPRTYIALLANGANNTGMRIAALKLGGGIALT
jgi:hypothetical protein